MIRFACPGCHWTHLANAAFVGYIARCVRCGVQLSIPDKSAPAPAAGAGRPAPANRVPVTVTPAPKAPPPVTIDDEPGEFEDEPDEFEEDGFEDAPPEVPEPRPARVLAERVPDDDRVADAEPISDLADEPDPPPAGVKPRSGWWPDPRKRVALVAVPVVLIAALAVAVVGSGGKPAPTPVVAETKSSAPPPPADPPPPPPPPAPPKPVPPPKPKVEPPRPQVAFPHDPQPDAPFRLTVAAFFQAHRDNPAGVEQGFAGKVIEVRGVCEARTGERIAIGEGAESTSGTGTGISTGPRLECSFRPTGAGPPRGLQPGDPVTVRGTYERGFQLTGCWVVSTTVPADDLYKGRLVQLTGVIRTSTAVAGSALSTAGPEILPTQPTLVLEQPGTDSRVVIRCLFRSDWHDRVGRLRPGNPVLLRGQCTGRAFQTVRVDDCALLTPEEADALPADVVQVGADRLTADYEADLLPADRPDPTADPVALAADDLAAAFQTDLPGATAAYRNRWVLLRGRVSSRNETAHTVTLETGTSQKYRVVAAFLPGRYADLPPAAVFTMRGVCSGVWSRGLIRVDNAEYVDPDPTGGRTELDHFPFRPGKELQYDYLQPTKAKDNPVRRVTVRFAGADQIRSVPVRYGTFPGLTLFTDPPARPRWTHDWSKAKLPETVFQYRIREGVVEVFHPVTQKPVGTPKQPGPQGPPAAPAPSPSSPMAENQSFWDPVLKTGLKKGRSWSAEAPDGSRVGYTVVSFGERNRRPIVTILRVVENPKTPDFREETTIDYARGVGEVRRVTKTRAASGVMVVAAEEQLVEGAELKADPSAASDSPARP